MLGEERNVVPHHYPKRDLATRVPDIVSHSTDPFKEHALLKNEKTSASAEPR